VLFLFSPDRDRVPQSGGLLNGCVYSILSSGRSKVILEELPFKSEATLAPKATMSVAMHPIIRGFVRLNELDSIPLHIDSRVRPAQPDVKTEQTIVIKRIVRFMVPPGIV
jgi:hypothetical protein